MDRTARKTSSARSPVKGTIEFEGVWRDKWPDRAMPMKVDRFGPGKKLGDVAGFFQNNFIPKLAFSGHKVGYFAIQDGNQLLWTLGDNLSYRKHGKIGDTPNFEWAGRVGVGIQIPGFEGTMDVVGGGWENAVYKVTVTTNRVKFEGAIKFEGVWRDKWPDRAIPMKVDRCGPGAKKKLGNIPAGFQTLFLPELQQSGHKVGYFAIQDGNQLLWSLGDNLDYRRHGKIGDTPNFEWAGRVGVGIQIPGFEGTMDVVGGEWDNAVYKVTLGDQAECRREYARVIFKAGESPVSTLRTIEEIAALDPSQALHAWFQNFPGLRRLIGSMLVSFYTHRTPMT